MAVYFRPCGSLLAPPIPRDSRDALAISKIGDALNLQLTPDDQTDYEDWMEPASILCAAIDAGVEIYILPKQPLQDAISAPLWHIPGDPCPDMLLGRQLNSDPWSIRKMRGFAWPITGETQVNHYAELNVFRDHAGRKIRLADMPGEKCTPYVRHFGEPGVPSELGKAMAEIAREGNGSVVVKQIYPAKALPVRSYRLDPAVTPELALQKFTDDVEYHIVRFEGFRAALLVQEEICMTHESRFFVIDGQVVTGAGCIESHTPFQNAPPGAEPAAFPAIWEVSRNSGELTVPGEDANQLADRLWSFAVMVAGKIRDEAPELTSYTLDLSLNGAGEPVIVELNPASNAGLYALDASRLFGAILDFSRDRSMAPEDEIPACS